MRKALTTCLFIGGAGAALAGSPEGVTVASCLACHGAGGGEGAIPDILGKPEDELLAKLKSFATPSAPVTIMARFVAGLTEAELQVLAHEISALEAKP